jgi:hypothetical protein
VQTLDILPAAVVKYVCPKCQKELGSVTAFNYHTKGDVCSKKMAKAAALLEKEALKRANTLSKKRPRQSISADRPEEAATGQGEGAPSSDQLNDSCITSDNEAQVKRALCENWTNAPGASLSDALARSPLLLDAVSLDALLEDMWDFSSATSLSDWIHYEMGNSGSSAAVDVWSLRAVDETENASPHVDLILPFTSVRRRAFGDSANRKSARSGGCDSTPDRAIDDVLINAGGPVMCIAVARRALSFQDTMKESKRNCCFVVGMGRVGFATSASPESAVPGRFGPGFDAPRRRCEAQSFDNLLEFWHSPLDSDDKCVSVPTLAYAVHLRRRGAVVSACWSRHSYTIPAPRSDSASTEVLHSSAQTQRLAYVGTLAIVCGDGSCLILIMPTAERVSTVAERTRSDARLNSDQSDSSLPNCPVIMEESVCRFVLKSSDPSDFILCASWSHLDALKITCGHSDGSISVWELNIETPRPQYRLNLSIHSSMNPRNDFRMPKTDSSRCAFGSALCLYCVSNV